MYPHGPQSSILALAVATCVGILTTPGSAQTDDPNALFAAGWHSASLAVTIDRPDGKSSAVKNVVSVAGHVYVPDANDLVAVSTTHAAAVHAFDQNGVEIHFDPEAVTLEPGRSWWLGRAPRLYRVELHLDPNQALPTALSRLDLTVEALYAESYMTVDLPLAVTEEPIELLPNCHVSITDVNVADEVCAVATKVVTANVFGSGTMSFDPNDGPWEETVIRDHVLRMSDLDVVFRATLVDGAGRTVPAAASHRTQSSDGVTTGTTRLEVRDCTGLDGLYLRYTVAMYPYDVPILLTLTNVAIPGL